MELNDLKKLTKTLQESESVIIDVWMTNIEDVLSQHTLPEYFRINHTHSIFKYFINVVEGKSKIGECPSMQKFLHDCSTEGFKVEDVYRICTNFRHALSTHLIQNNLMSKDVYAQLNYVLDENLSGLLSIYSHIVEEKNSMISEQAQWINQYEKVINNILIVSKADVKGKIIYANDKFVEISGFSKSELMGQPHNIVRDDDMPQAIFKNMWSTIKDKKAWSGVVKNRRKDGSSYYVSTIILPILDKNGEIIEFLSSRTDLSELVQLQKATEKQEKLLIKQSVMAEMGDMLGLISHQWKQPLSSINMILNNIILKESLKKDSNNTEMDSYNQIINIVKFLSLTIDDFQSFFKPDKLKHNVNSLIMVQSVLNLVKAKLNNLQIAVNINENNAFDMNLFENNLKQVVLNIYNNAIDVLADKKVENPRIDIRFEKSDDIGKIIIADNGGGISPSLLPDKLFELYETSKGDKGSGIGLRLCKIIIEEKFDGRIYASNNDEGAVFTIELPLHNV